jgi:hypothetical protein
MAQSLYEVRVELHKLEDRQELGEVLTADEKSRMSLLAAILEDHEMEMRMIAVEDQEDYFHYPEEY